MGSLCGIIDFSSQTTDFSSLLKLWQTLAPLGRACAYINRGNSLCADKWHGIHSDKTPFINFEADGDLCTLILDSPPTAGDITKRIIEAYRKNGCKMLCEIDEHPTFALLDEGKKTLILSCGRSPLYFARVGEKIIFASDKRGVDIFFKNDATLQNQQSTVTLSPYGFAILCDILPEK